MKMIDINKELGITSIDFNNIDINNNTEDNIDDFFKETLDDLDKFDEKAWKKGDGLIFILFLQKNLKVLMQVYIYLLV